MKINESILDLIGDTPVVKLSKIKEFFGFNSDIYAKIESFNPAGSVKDRIAFAMINDLEKQGIISKDTVIIEPTSGNTGIGLAFIGAVKGLRVILTMPETMSIERRQLITAYGAEIVLTDGTLGMKGAIEKAHELNESIDNSIIPSQFTNMSNPNAHYNNTAKEIYNVFGDELDYIISGVGTGGTISGIGKFYKEKNLKAKFIAVEPETSPVLSKGVAGKHKIQGIGAGFKPDTLNLDVVDSIKTVSDDNAFKFGKMIARTEGILVGISSGAVLSTAVDIALKDKNASNNILIILPDTGHRYLSTDLYKE